MLAITPVPLPGEYYHYTGLNKFIPCVFYVFVVIYAKAQVDNIIIKDGQGQVFMIPYSLWIKMEIESEREIHMRNNV